MKAFLARIIQDLDDLEPSTWVQQTEGSSQHLDQLKGKKMMNTSILREWREELTTPSTPRCHLLPQMSIHRRRAHMWRPSLWQLNRCRRYRSYFWFFLFLLSRMISAPSRSNNWRINGIRNRWICRRLRSRWLRWLTRWRPAWRRYERDLVNKMIVRRTNPAQTLLQDHT